MRTASIALGILLAAGCASAPRVFQYPRLGITIIKDEGFTLSQWQAYPSARCFYAPPCTIYASTPECIVHELGHCEYGATHDGAMKVFNWDEERNRP